MVTLNQMSSRTYENSRNISNVGLSHIRKLVLEEAEELLSESSTAENGKRKKARAKNWVMTKNNPDIVDRLKLDGLYPLHASYVVFQYEIGKQGTKHIQAYIHFNKQLRMQQVKDLVGDKCHLEVMRGKASQAAAYCKKDDTRDTAENSGPFEYGSLPVVNGCRNDINEFVEAALERDLPESELIEQYAPIVAKYPRFVERVQRLRRERQVVITPLTPDRPWQQNLVEWLRMEPDPRKVVWYVDLVGNTGKSHFCRHYQECSKMIITGGKHADMYYGYKFERVVFFDFARSKEDGIPYEVIENFKNGFFYSSKYESHGVSFNPPHIVCFANFHPDISKLSADRWEIINITPGV